MLEKVWHDIRYASRTLAKTPGFTLVGVMTLALGIGATTSAFSVFHNLLFNAFAAKDSNPLAVPVMDNPRKECVANRCLLTVRALIHVRLRKAHTCLGVFRAHHRGCNFGTL